VIVKKAIWHPPRAHNLRATQQNSVTHLSSGIRASARHTLLHAACRQHLSRRSQKHCKVTSLVSPCSVHIHHPAVNFHRCYTLNTQNCSPRHVTISSVGLVCFNSSTVLQHINIPPSADCIELCQLKSTVGWRWFPQDKFFAYLLQRTCNIKSFKQ
jgi:hypothetical protein